GLLRTGANLVEAPAVHELEDQEVFVPGVAEIERLHQVAVIQRRGDVRLVEEHACEGGVGGEGREDPLQYDGLLEPLGPALEGEEDLGHPSVGELLHHAVTYAGRHCRGGYRISPAGAGSPAPPVGS